MRLINADELKAKVEAMVKHKIQESDYDYGRNQILDYVADILIEDAPTIEAEPVVRCRDCRWWEDMYGNGIKGYCHACKHGYHSPTWEIGIRRTTDPDFYCGDGERTEE